MDRQRFHVTIHTIRLSLFPLFFFSACPSSPTVIIHFYPLLFIRFLQFTSKIDIKLQLSIHRLTIEIFPKDIEIAVKILGKWIFSPLLLVPSSSLAPPPHTSLIRCLTFSLSIATFSLVSNGGRRVTGGGNSVAFF